MSSVHSKQVQNEFCDILKSIPSEMGLYREEFEKLYNSFVKSMESEDRLNKRQQEIKAEMNASEDQIVHLKLEERDSENVKKRLQLDIEVAWSKASDSHQMEAEKQEKMSSLGVAIKELKETISNGIGAEDGDDQESEIALLRRQRQELYVQVDTEETFANQLRMELEQLQIQVDKKQKESQRIEEEIATLSRNIDEKKILTNEQQRKKEHGEVYLKKKKLELEEDKRRYAEMEEKKVLNRNELKRKQNKLQEIKSGIDNCIREYENMTRVGLNIDNEAKALKQSNVITNKQNMQIIQEIKIHANNTVRVEQDIAKIEKLTAMTKARIAKVDTDKSSFEEEKEDYKSQVNDMVNLSIEAVRKQGDVLQKRNDDLVREREVLTKMLVKVGDQTQSTYDLIKVNENTKKNLENEINGYRKHVKKQREMVQQLVGDRERYEKDAEQATKKYLTALEEVKLQELQMSALQRKIQEAEGKLKQQQNLYEAVRNDRNLYSKNLMESQKEITQMKRRFKIMNHQIEQLKEEITTKDHSLVKEHFDHHRVDKERESLKNELTRIKKQIQSSEQIVVNQEQEVLKLNNIIQEADEERLRQLKECNAVIHDRDNLRNQLMQRNAELSVLYEKIKIQRSSLRKGSHQYEERVKAIRTLRSNINNLGNEDEQTSQQVSNTTEMKNEVHRLERELLHERNKIKALSDELERPLNVHRWRKLEGSDPKRYEMIRKIQQLQKKIIKMTEQVMLKDQLISEKEALYVQLKNVLARQPGPEVGEQLVLYKQNLKDKQREWKAMESELQMYKSQVEQYKRDINDTNNEIDKLQKAWNRQMERDAVLPAPENP